MKRIRLIVCCLAVLSCVFLSGCRTVERTAETTASQDETEEATEETSKGTGAISTETETAESAGQTEEEISDRAEEILDGMTVEEMIGQLFVVRPEVISGKTEWTDSAAEKLAEYPVGGFCLFAANIETPEQLSKFLGDLTSHSKIAPLFAVDEEGGKVARIARNGNFGVTAYPPMGEIAETGDANAAYEVGLTIGSYLKKFGFTLDFAPVADVNTNPDNPVIGSRAFGSDPVLAASMVANAVKGFREAGIGCTLKHFPGHGDTSSDTHTGSAVSYKTWEEMKECEMLPFISGIEAGADAVMVAHILTPNVTSDGLPCSLSYTMITEKLRGELGFDGLVITDALAMNAIAGDFTSREAAVTSFLAGVDILLMPDDFEEAFDGIREAAENGTITPERLRESVLRILRFKLKYGIVE